MNKKEQQFVQTVWEYYLREGRHDLPWRKTHNPYRILVSEVMLQQTQVERVIPKYREFLKQFPALAQLARAPLGDVLRVWQGLGYNRRAKMLHECAKQIDSVYNGSFPRDFDALVILPGIGSYTAGAIMAFVWNTPVPLIETNIRSVIIHHFFKNDTDVSDTEVMHIVARTLDTENPREWYYALMDYGAYIKRTYGNQNSRSKHYTRQSVFKGSDRQIRGVILRLLILSPHTRMQLLTALPFEDIRVDAQLEKLIEEGLVRKRRTTYSIPN